MPTKKWDTRREGTAPHQLRNEDDGESASPEPIAAADPDGLICGTHPSAPLAE
jgi:hypothetical protein